MGSASSTTSASSSSNATAVLLLPFPRQLVPQCRDGDGRGVAKAWRTPYKLLFWQQWLGQHALQRLSEVDWHACETSSKYFMPWHDG